ncbi:hypothetical protein DY000_02022103 [Brassica cretica]|uniref:Uncharacterized protein n=1 Tax=Brassica cretica TaxID=69181 RepID=A0ABQ7EFK7_BRACR|nr:hypothetical protein DY000_02022103 [Brassica cretica]
MAFHSEEDKSDDYLIKIVLVEDCAVRTSNLLARFARDEILVFNQVVLIFHLDMFFRSGFDIHVFQIWSRLWKTSGSLMTECSFVSSGVQACLCRGMIYNSFVCDISLSHSPNLFFSHTTHLQPSSSERRTRRKSDGGGVLRWLLLLTTTTGARQGEEVALHSGVSGQAWCSGGASRWWGGGRAVEMRASWSAETEEKCSLVDVLGVMIPTCCEIQAHNTSVPFTTHTIQSLFMTQEFFTQFTAAARYIWGGSRIHNIHYEVSENTSDMVYKIITLSVLAYSFSLRDAMEALHGCLRLLPPGDLVFASLRDLCRDLSFFVSSLNLMGFNA